MFISNYISKQTTRKGASPSLASKISTAELHSWEIMQCSHVMARYQLWVVFTEASIWIFREIFYLLTYEIFIFTDIFYVAWYFWWFFRVPVALFRIILIFNLMFGFNMFIYVIFWWILVSRLVTLEHFIFFIIAGFCCFMCNF